MGWLAGTQTANISINTDRQMKRYRQTYRETSINKKNKQKNRHIDGLTESLAG